MKSQIKERFNGWVTLASSLVVGYMGIWALQLALDLGVDVMTIAQIATAMGVIATIVSVFYLFRKGDI